MHQHHPRTDTAWYLTPEALALIAPIRANPPVAENHAKSYVITTDRWQQYAGPQVDALTALYDRAAARVSGADFPAFYQQGNAQDVIAAVTDDWLCGVHFMTDDARLEAIRTNVAAASLKVAA